MPRFKVRIVIEREVEDETAGKAAQKALAPLDRGRPPLLDADIEVTVFETDHLPSKIIRH